MRLCLYYPCFLEQDKNLYSETVYKFFGTGVTITKLKLFAVLILIFKGKQVSLIERLRPCDLMARLF